MGKRFTDVQMNDIITRFMVFGESRAHIAESYEVTDQAIGKLIITFNLVKVQDWDAIIDRLRKGLSNMPHVVWAINRLHIVCPTELMQQLQDAYEIACSRKKTQRLKKGTESEQPVVETSDNTGLYLLKILEALNRHNELMEQLMDVVLPKYIGDIKDNVNANADVLSGHLKTCEQAMEKVVCNTRKRGL